ncbi:DUF3891 family protein [Halobacillus litoralis]|uniref:DUF3891 family protein n=1 Tax=Halobacillus litoralis TaxID=45668 RepID=A0A845DW72_9BACI|nr:DUF3891 family protein [Halobacillus litoralis]MYL20735.1 DUF3891 family protein [Halobacillus litoralis]MYL39325.1 DUF3891 family protein [Halobacillus litoralis]
MIVIEKTDHFIMIPQHEHAGISGSIVDHWKNHFLLRSKLREEADWAIRQHDRAWIPLDEKPVWNDEKQRPYTFVDYPLEEKLLAYERGIGEVASKSFYAGMLCSMHYASFFQEDSHDPLIVEFLKQEEKRRKDLYEWMEMDIPYDVYHLHFKRLQFCDDLSLYVCMQEPGTPKEQEIPWFKDGFRQTFDFAPEGIYPQWDSARRVILDPFPFEQSFHVQIPYRRVYKEEIKRRGLVEAFQEADIDPVTVTFVGKEEKPPLS